MSNTPSRNGLKRAICVTFLLVTGSAFAATMDYTITFADRVGAPNNCFAGDIWYNCGNPGAGFQWTDATPAGSTINSVTIRFNHNIQCDAGTFTGNFNAGATTTWMPSSQFCSCSTPRVAIQTVTAVTPSDLVIGGNNIFSIRNPGGSCEGLSNISSGLGAGNWAVVTVDFDDAGGGGGGAVPAASTTGLIITALLMLAGSMFFLRTKAA